MDEKFEKRNEDHEHKGNLIIIGGAEDKKGESEILEEVVQISGGGKAHF